MEWISMVTRKSTRVIYLTFKMKRLVERHG